MDYVNRFEYEGFTMRSFLSALFSAMVAFNITATEVNWPQLRGPRGDGTSLAAHVPLHWGETNNIAWKASIPGRGRSSPVVLGDRIWLTLAIERGVVRKRIEHDDMQTAEHVSLEAVCLDRASGKIIWRTPLFDVDNPAPVHWFNSWATPTPVVEPGRLYCDFGTFGTACVNAKTGKILWKTRVPVDHQVGPGSSPVLYQKLLVLVRDGRDAQFLTALDKETGQTVWKTDRPPINASSPNLKKSFVTPLLVSAEGATQLISPGAHWVVSYEPSTGKEIWRARHGDGFSIGSCPVFGHGTAFFSTGCMKPQLWAVRVDGAGDVTTTHAALKTTRQVPVMSSPVLSGDELYWISDDGIANCADSGSGEVHWQERLNQQHLASPLLAEGRVYFFGKEGKTTVVKAGKPFEKLAENQLDGVVVATPAILDRTIFLRTDGHLYRIGKD
jgi:outer membrane protein assembly factor BamB